MKIIIIIITTKIKEKLVVFKMSSQRWLDKARIRYFMFDIRAWISHRISFSERLFFGSWTLEKKNVNTRASGCTWNWYSILSGLSSLWRVHPKRELNEQAHCLWVAVTASTVDHWTKLAPKRVQCWGLLLQHATGLYKVHIVTPPTGSKAVVVTVAHRFFKFPSGSPSLYAF
jgi:hypothetical protein